MTVSDEQFGQRVRALLELAIAALDPADRQARITYCQENNQHGIRMHIDDHDGLLEFTWGGRRLAMVHRDTLDNDRPMHFGLVNDTPTPDTVPEDWTC
ncbi:hypothetical protein [Mycobacterium sp.]|uniref:hypothetical protein n=1 Tax=Mycobacterium sp. TaxID=1785 RepID=UPI000CB535D0|nr:hypothetical protein [Mycobacterium sp.]PJE07945.1 MAG: hypothetical protein CK428_21630 [Mycobacterium sp.]